MAIRRLYEELIVDSSRRSFSSDLEEAHASLRGSAWEPGSVERVIGEWLSKAQPCLFGRLAAREGQLRYCVLTEEHLLDSDDAIRERIQDARLEWLRAGFNGEASGFVLLAVSERLIAAKPDDALANLALALCSLHLHEKSPAQVDEVCTDQIFLEKPGHKRRTWRWTVGINFFGAQGDRRWWHDHRIPGGIALSMNSVGNMAKAGAIRVGMKRMDETIETVAEDWSDTHVSSLNKALVLAMRTINLASKGLFPGTSLVHVADKPESIFCPHQVTPELRSFNRCEYQGKYHTDYTVPSRYFREDHGEEGNMRAHDDLDFTYLYDRSSEDFATMGTGVPIRASELSEDDERQAKQLRAFEEESSVDDEPLLLAALRARPQ